MQQAQVLRQLRFPFECDQSRATLKSKVGPHPLEENQKAIAKTNQVEDMDSEPQNPGKKASQLKFAQLQDRKGATDCREIPFVPIPVGCHAQIVQSPSNAPLPELGQASLAVALDGSPVTSRIASLAHPVLRDGCLTLLH